MHLKFLRVAVLAALPVLPLSAQSGGGDGYLFSAPHATLSIRGGLARPTASSDVFSFVTERLTVNRGDFVGVSFASDLGFRLTHRIDLVLGTGISTRERRSEYRDLVDMDDLPIEQRTTFRRIPMTAGVKVHLRPSGRSVGKLAWVPTRLAPYVAAGGGMMYYVFKQDGDFVDYQTFDVFRTSLRSTDVAGMAYGAVGGTYSLAPRIGVNVEVRYDRARGPLDADFRDFDPIDLSGAGLTAGFLFRF